ncbi:SoxR reducing system RseC family protein [Streptodolium elevatio]
MAPTSYFEQLAAALHARGVPEARVAMTVEEVAGYAADAGADPYAEFGPVEEFAARLAGTGGPGEPEAGAERWVWTADAYLDQRMMNRFGAQGWEIQRVDGLGRFVSRRPRESTLRWEYRRDVVERRDRASHAAELAPEGWEPCGHWMFLAYYKRPLAAVEGPAAWLADPPRHPERSVYFTRRAYAALAVPVLVIAALVVMAVLGEPIGPGSLDAATAAGMACGAVVGFGVAAFFLRRMRQEFRQASRFPPVG